MLNLIVKNGLRMKIYPNTSFGKTVRRVEGCRGMKKLDNHIICCTKEQAGRVFFDAISHAIKYKEQKEGHAKANS